MYESCFQKRGSSSVKRAGLDKREPTVFWYDHLCPCSLAGSSFLKKALVREKLQRKSFALLNHHKASSLPKPAEATLQVNVAWEDRRKMSCIGETLKTLGDDHRPLKEQVQGLSTTSQSVTKQLSRNMSGIVGSVDNQKRQIFDRAKKLMTSSHNQEFDEAFVNAQEKTEVDVGRVEDMTQKQDRVHNNFQLLQNMATTI